MMESPKQTLCICPRALHMHCWSELGINPEHIFKRIKSVLLFQK